MVHWIYIYQYIVQKTRPYVRKSEPNIRIHYESKQHHQQHPTCGTFPDRPNVRRPGSSKISHEDHAVLLFFDSEIWGSIVETSNSGHQRTWEQFPERRSPSWRGSVSHTRFDSSIPWPGCVFGFRSVRHVLPVLYAKKENRPEISRAGYIHWPRNRIYPWS